MQKSLGRTLIGLALILIGGGLLARNYDLFTPDFDYYFLNWPMFAMIIGFVITIVSRGKSFGIILFIVGGLYYFARFNNYDPGEIINNYWPIVFIIIGLSFIFRRNSAHYEYKHYKNKDYKNHKNEYEDFEPPKNNYQDINQDSFEINSIFNHVEMRASSQNLKEIKILTIFGATDLDLSNAKLANNARVEVTTIFGGTNLVIPSDWNVINNINAMFGGSEDKRRKSAPIEGQKEQKITINGFALFGGMDIRS